MLAIVKSVRHEPVEEENNTSPARALQDQLLHGVDLRQNQGKP